MGTSTRDFRNEMTNEIRTKILVKFVNGDFALGLCKKLIPSKDFLKKALHADGLVKYFIR